MPAGVPDVQAIVTPTVGALLIGVLFSIWYAGSRAKPSFYSLFNFGIWQSVRSEHIADMVLLPALPIGWHPSQAMGMCSISHSSLAKC